MVLHVAVEEEVARRPLAAAGAALVLEVETGAGPMVCESRRKDCAFWTGSLFGPVAKSLGSISGLRRQRIPPPWRWWTWKTSLPAWTSRVLLGSPRYERGIGVGGSPNMYEP